MGNKLLIKCPNCGKHNWRFVKKCWYCSTVLGSHNYERNNDVPLKKPTKSGRFINAITIITLILVVLFYSIIAIGALTSYLQNHSTNSYSSNQSYSSPYSLEEQNLMNSSEFQRGINNFLDYNYGEYSSQKIVGTPYYGVTNMANLSCIKIYLSVSWDSRNGHSGTDTWDLQGDLPMGKYYSIAKQNNNLHYEFIGTYRQEITYCPFNSSDNFCLHRDLG